MEPGDLVPVHPPNDRERPPGISGDSVGRAKRLHNGYDSYELKEGYTKIWGVFPGLSCGDVY